MGLLCPDIQSHPSTDPGGEAGTNASEQGQGGGKGLQVSVGPVVHLAQDHGYGSGPKVV